MSLYSATAGTLCVLAALFFFLTIAPLEKTAAQTTLDLIFGTDLSIELIPEHPAPGERVRAEARSNLLDLSGATLSWRADGKTISSGVGQAAVDILAPGLGRATRVTLDALEGGLAFAQASAVIRPVELDLLWEADSYVPPFFRGRALPSAGTNLRLEAIPHFLRDGAAIPTSDIIFTWKRNGYVINSVSGRGKSRAIIESPALFGENTISVEAKTTDELLFGEASARIKFNEPRLVLYQNHPVFGIAFHRALGESDQIPETEAAFSAIPYYIDATGADDGALVYRWRVNQTEIPNDPKRPCTITINAEGSTGQALVELALIHLTNLFVNSSVVWNILLQGSGAAASFKTTTI